MCACTCGYKNCLCAGDKNHSRQGQKSSVFRERLSACDEDGDDDEDGNTSAQVTESQSFASEIDDHMSTLVCFAKFHNGGSLQLTSSRLSDFKVENFLKV
eukprot:gene1719-1918_t